MLRVPLLEIAQAAHELLARNVGVVGQEVSLSGLTGVVDEDVGVGCETGDCADHVAVIYDQSPVFSASFFLG